MYIRDGSVRFAPSWNTGARDSRAYRQVRRYRPRGLGETPQQINSIVTTGAETTTSLLVAFGAVGGPIGAAIGAAIAVASQIVNFFRGCGQTCIVASQDADKLEPLLQKNLAGYLAVPVNQRYASIQAAFLNNADTLLNALRTACSDPNLGDAGRRCISERLDASACHWKASPGGWQGTTYTPYGPAGSGDACWNWKIGYRDPIANDPNVVPDPSPVTQTSDVFSQGASSILQTLGLSPNSTFNWSDLLLPGGLILLALLLPSGKR